MGRIKESIKYITGADFLRNRMIHEDMYAIQSRGTEDIQPWETSKKTAKEIYILRSKTAIELPFVVLGRVTGVDAAVKQIKRYRKTKSK